MGMKKCNCDLTGIPPEQLAEAHVEPDVRTAYMDGTDFLYELGNDMLGHVVAADPEILQNETKHEMKSCGIAEVEVKFIRWVKEPK
jgi:hypothetical protein